MANLPAPALTSARLRLEQDARRWLLPLARRLAAVPPLRWRQLVLILMAAWVLASLARLVWLLLPPVAQPPATGPVPVNAAAGNEHVRAAPTAVDIDAIVGWHLFGKAGSVAAPVVSGIEAQARDTSLNLKLVGLVQSNDATQARAILLIGGHQQQFAIGDQLPASGKVTLAKVLADRAIISNNGRYETLWLYDQAQLRKLGTARETPPPASAPAASRTLDLRDDHTVTRSASAYRDQLYSNPTALTDLIQVSMQKDGLRIRPGRDPKAFAAFGLKPNDVVTAINGVSVTDPGNAVQLYNQMRTAQQATLTIRRGGEDVVIEVSLQGAGANQ